MDKIVKIKCYVQEYLNNENRLCARIRDKKTNKIVSLTGKNIDKNHFLNFLSQIKIQKEKFSTIFERNGEDSVLIKGKIDVQNDNEIVVKIYILCGGYLVV